MYRGQGNPGPDEHAGKGFEKTDLFINSRVPTATNIGRCLEIRFENNFNFIFSTDSFFDNHQ